MTVDLTSVPRTVASTDGTLVGFVEYGSPHPRGGEASVLFIPALGVPIDYYSTMLTRWAEAGRHIVAVELRGMPLSPVANIRQQRFGYSTLINHDFPAVVSQALRGAASFIAVGHSVGGQLALLATPAGSIQPLAIVAIASGTSSPAARGARLGRVARRGQVAFVRVASFVRGHWPGDRLGFGGRQPRSLMRDWCHEGAHGRYRLQGDDTDYEVAFKEITTPILILSLDGDRIIPERAVDHLIHRLPAHTNYRRLTSNTADGFDHIRWVRHEPQTIIDAIERWDSQR